MNKENLPLAEALTGQIVVLGGLALNSEIGQNISAVAAVVALDGIRRMFKDKK